MDRPYPSATGLEEWPKYTFPSKVLAQLDHPRIRAWVQDEGGRGLPVPIQGGQEEGHEEGVWLEENHQVVEGCC